jgi:hypothetical protein
MLEWVTEKIGEEALNQAATEICDKVLKRKRE